MGKTTMTWKNAQTVVLKDGKWMVKSMVEGGWGDSQGMKAETMPKKTDMTTATGAR